MLVSFFRLLSLLTCWSNIILALLNFDHNFMLIWSLSISIANNGHFDPVKGLTCADNVRRYPHMQKDTTLKFLHLVFTWPITSTTGLFLFERLFPKTPLRLGKNNILAKIITLKFIGIAKSMLWGILNFAHAETPWNKV